MNPPRLVRSIGHKSPGSCGAGVAVSHAILSDRPATLPDDVVWPLTAGFSTSLLPPAGLPTRKRNR